MINGLNRLHRVAPQHPLPIILPQTAAAASSSAAATGTGRGSSSTHGSWSVSGTLRHKIALRRIRSRGHPRRGASLQPILPLVPSLPHPPKSCALWPPGVALKSLFRCGTATPGEGPVPAPRDDDARNPMPAHSSLFHSLRSAPC